MSELDYNRCSNDTMRASSAKIGENPETGKALELNINGVATVISIQSAMMTLSAAMKAGHEEDFLEKVALTLFGKLTSDPHAICPLLAIVSMIMIMLAEGGGVSFNEKGLLGISSPEMPLNPDETCMLGEFDEEDEEDDDELYET